MLRQTVSLHIFKRLSSTNFTWSILKYLDPSIIQCIQYICLQPQIMTAEPTESSSRLIY